MEIKEFINKKFLFFDGAMGTMLQKYGIETGEIPETYNILHPEIITKIHKEYLNAGANIITTNTFGANELKLKNLEYSVEDIISSAVNIAKDAIKECDDKENKFVALDIGPIGQLLEPLGTLKFEDAYNIFKKQVKAGVKAGCNLFLIETMSDIYEVKAAILAAKENSNLPVFCTMTFGEDGRTLTGADPLTVVTALEGFGVDVLGINCSLGPKEILPIITKILEYSSIPVMVQPNAGLPRVEDQKTVYDITVKEYSKYMKEIAQKGSAILGGCCGTTPEYIESMIDEIGNMQIKINTRKEYTAVCSGSKTVIIGKATKVIGERINPTGKKKFKEALKNNDMDYILNEAIMQKENGADILDVNVGLPEIDEKKMMKIALREIQSIINLPLQIDSVRCDVIEEAVRMYNGKPIINSVNGKEKSMDEIFPIAKKYGAVVLGLTLDEKGIPSKAEERFKIAEKIVKKAEEYGIDKKNILIDCLVLTASAQQAEVMETLKAVSMVKKKLGVNTVLGVSNVSFGLPNRPLLNRTFLAAALYAGLDTPIINPMSKDIMETIYSFKVLANMDKEAKEYIEVNSSIENKKESINDAKEEKDIKKIIINGLKEEATTKTRELLKTVEPMKIVNNELIPALDIVGEKYEKGEIFLPQLIQSAETVKNAFKVIKEFIEAKGSKQESKGKIILATVKGDIHDIGKNIVKVLLQNYGYDVIDLGKDTPIELVVKTALIEKVKLVGLSALMTTTVKNMEETITALRENGAMCKIMVGGAVLNQEYADMIKADFYAKDARQSVEIAKKIFKR